MNTDWSIGGMPVKSLDDMPDVKGPGRLALIKLVCQTSAARLIAI
jgi:hypothetical protein